MVSLRGAGSCRDPRFYWKTKSCTSELAGASEVSDRLLGQTQDLLGDVGLCVKSMKGGGHTLPLSPGEHPPVPNVLKRLALIMVTVVLHPTGGPGSSVQVPACGMAPKLMVTNL